MFYFLRSFIKKNVIIKSVLSSEPELCVIVFLFYIGYSCYYGIHISFYGRESMTELYGFCINIVKIK